MYTLLFCLWPLRTGMSFASSAGLGDRPHPKRTKLSTGMITTTPRTVLEQDRQAPAVQTAIKHFMQKLSIAALPERKRSKILRVVLSRVTYDASLRLQVHSLQERSETAESLRIGGHNSVAEMSLDTPVFTRILTPLGSHRHTFQLARTCQCSLLSFQIFFGICDDWVARRKDPTFKGLSEPSSTSGKVHRAANVPVVTDLVSRPSGGADTNKVPLRPSKQDVLQQLEDFDTHDRLLNLPMVTLCFNCHSATVCACVPHDDQKLMPSSTFFAEFTKSAFTRAGFVLTSLGDDLWFAEHGLDANRNSLLQVSSRQ